MKKIVILLAFVLIVVGTTNAQSLKSSPAYWVVETNIQHPGYSIVKFYSAQNNLIHQVKIEGVNIDIREPKQRRKLDQLLKDYNERVVVSLKKTKSKKSI